MTLSENIWNNRIGGFVLYAKSTVDGSIVAVKVNPVTGALQVDTEVTVALDPTGLATGAKQDTGNASLTNIEADLSLNDLGSPVKIDNDTTSKSVAIPTGTKAIFVASTGGVSNLGIDADATASSSPIVFQNGYLTYPITDSMTLACYGAVGTSTYFNFLG